MTGKVGPKLENSGDEPQGKSKGLYGGQEGIDHLGGK